MKFRFCVRPEDGPTLRLDYRAFSYTGKFVIGSTGKAVLVTETSKPAAPEWRPDRGVYAGEHSIV